uniref:Uncharacterized protein n=1 Tax=Glossina morsitans morsitans TaxID=37546 RepID=A0A1B0GEZ3_GLOMM
MHEYERSSFLNTTTKTKFNRHLPIVNYIYNKTRIATNSKKLIFSALSVRTLYSYIFYQYYIPSTYSKIVTFCTSNFSSPVRRLTNQQYRIPDW